MKLRRFAAPLVLAALLAGCATTRLVAENQPEAPTASQTEAAVTAQLPTPADTPTILADSDALKAFRRACPVLLKRKDASGLTINEDWSAACADAEADPGTFFAKHFTPVRLNDGRGLATGYFEPEIRASKTTTPGSVPILRRPPEIVDADLGLFAEELKGRTIRGMAKDGKLVRAPDRAAIEAGAFGNRNLEIAWAPDPAELFFLQIQGSGRIRFDNGEMWRIGYDGQNGHAYVPIGRLLRERGELEEVSMESIKEWLRTHPERGRQLMHENPSWIFFRILPSEGRDPSDGPPGALGIPLIPKANVAADPGVMPLGAPVWVETTVVGERFAKLMVAADTGGAIRGANRFDIFFGAGEEAARKAGPLSSPLTALILLPKSAAERLPAPPLP